MWYENATIRKGGPLVSVLRNYTSTQLHIYATTHLRNYPATQLRNYFKIIYATLHDNGGPHVYATGRG